MQRMLLECKVRGFQAEESASAKVSPEEGAWHAGGAQRRPGSQRKSRRKWGQTGRQDLVDPGL